MTTTPAAAILALVWPWAFPQGIPERMDHYETRLGTISEAVAEVARDEQEAGGIITLWRRESMFRLDVHAGTTRGDHGLAICMGSIHPSKAVPDWAELAGIELQPTIRCARRTAQFLRSGVWMCAHGDRSTMGLAMGFELYARGHCAEPGEESRSRAKRTNEIAAMLWRAT